MTTSRLSVSSLLVVFTVLAAACGTPATPAPPTAMPPTVAAPTQAAATAVPATLAPQPTPSGPASLAVGKSAQFAAFLTDDKGMTLYINLKDTPSTSSCYDKCAANWPPVLTAGAAAAGTGLDATKLGTLKRTDGNTQVTYNGWPLYHFAKDKQPGDTAGQGLLSTWYVVSPTGDAIKQ